MSLRVCLKCSTAYAVGPQACPQCGAPTRDAVYDWEDDVVAKASAEQGATLYVPEGGDTSDVPEGVRLVGPGAPEAQEAAEDDADAPEVVPDPPDEEPEPDSTPPPSSPESSDPGDDTPGNAEVRAWAKDNGLDVADRGPVSQAVLDAYAAAHPAGPED